MRHKIILAGLACLLFGALSTQAQKQVEFAKLRDYVGDSNQRRGERFIVPDAPIADDVDFIKAYKLYSFAAESDRGLAFYTSAAIAKVLRQNLNSRAVLMSVTCILVEFTTDEDIYRAPFATKVEGINMDGEIVWRVTGPPPAKLKFR